MSLLSVGTIIRCRNREWVVLPSENEDLLRLRPLSGGDEEECTIYLPLTRYGLDQVEPAQFPLPQPTDGGDSVGVRLLWDAARLTLRDGAGPFRSLGRISVRPRAYQFVPLLMALRLFPVRVFIADDVGVGKTIEALLIARELIDRGDVRRLCVLCPPYLCDQWQQEMREKFHLDAVVITPSTVSQLERQLPSGAHSVFGYFPYIVVSIDFAKSERRRANFLQHCPELVIVDEVHGAARPATQNRNQQQRHELLREIAANPNRHLILLTATPHSGVEESFRSLLGLLRPEFEQWEWHRLSEDQRKELARHFVQRRRADVRRWLGEDTPFPERQSEEVTYTLSPEYLELFQRTYRFCRELVKTGETLTGWRRRLRYWSALALLRCVMSSPAAAVTALTQRARGEDIGDGEAADELFSAAVTDNPEHESTDVQPPFPEDAEDPILSEQRQLRELRRLAERLRGSDKDTKVVKCAQTVAKLLREGFHPIVWCRFVATSDYVAEELKKRLTPQFPDLRVVSITGKLSEEERREKVRELASYPRRVLVATDCLSEGINLQEHFTAVIHYDLPWNPNRLEQREGRVDRFGQTAPVVKAVLLFGSNNPVDGVVLDVLLRKAQQIRKHLGVTVPVPVDSDSVFHAILNALFLRAQSIEQLRLFEQEMTLIKPLHDEWNRAAERERESRTRFAQHAIKPDEVERELRETDQVLGDPAAVERFTLNACQRLGVTVRPETRQGLRCYRLSGLSRLPDLVKGAVPDGAEEWLVTFTSPAPEGVAYLGRNHPFVSALARYLLEAALAGTQEAPAPRCGVMPTDLVQRRTVLLLLRLRFLLHQPDKTPQLAEEVLVAGFRGLPPDPLEWLPEEETLRLLERAQPTRNIPREQQTRWLQEVLSKWDEILPQLSPIIKQRSQRLLDAHRRIRQAVDLRVRGLRVEPKEPPDLLGVLVLLPEPKGVTGQ